MLAAGVRGTGRTSVLFVHGLTANRFCFQHLENALHESGGGSVTTLTYDLRGRGKSDKPEGTYGPRVHAHDIASLLSAQKLKRFAAARPVIAAHSLGAYAALEFAALYPDRVKGLILLDGGARLSRFEALRVYLLLRLSFIRLGRRFADPLEYLNVIRNSPLIGEWTPELEAMLRYDMVRDEKGWGLDLPVHVIESELNSAGASLSWRKTLFHAGESGFPRPQYTAIRCPVLLVRASKFNLFPGDHILPVRAQAELASRLSRCRCIEIPANHYSIILERQPLLNAAILQFLREDTGALPGNQ